MNQTAVIYYSAHHNNTEKVLEAMNEEKKIDMIPVSEAKNKDLSKYKNIGLASGIYFGKMNEKLQQFASTYDFNKEQNVFLVYTSGSNGKKNAKEMKEILQERNVNIKGTFSCRGYDTYGPFKIIGGINRKHPNNKDLENAKEFIKKL